MHASNIAARERKSYGVRTFSVKEMAFDILGLMHPLLFSIAQVEPIRAGLNGGMDRLPDLAGIATRIRLSLNKSAIFVAQSPRIIPQISKLSMVQRRSVSSSRPTLPITLISVSDFPALESLAYILELHDGVPWQGHCHLWRSGLGEVQERDGKWR